MAILIVDDNPVNRRILQFHLDGAGFETVSAKGGSEALSVLTSRSDVELMLVDIVMPEMNGWQLIAEVRKHAEWAGLPVIVISAYGDLPAVQKAKDLGITRFVVKPINTDYLLREIRSALREPRPG